MSEEPSNQSAWQARLHEIIFEAETPAGKAFDVSLLIVFESRAAHDAYQAAPRHLEFIERNASLWKGVRVFDSYLGAD